MINDSAVGKQLILNLCYLFISNANREQNPHDSKMGNLVTIFGMTVIIILFLVMATIAGTFFILWNSDTLE